MTDLRTLAEGPLQEWMRHDAHDLAKMIREAGESTAESLARVVERVYQNRSAPGLEEWTKLMSGAVRQAGADAVRFSADLMLPRRIEIVGRLAAIAVTPALRNTLGALARAVYEAQGTQHDEGRLSSLLQLLRATAYDYESENGATQAVLSACTVDDTSQLLLRLANDRRVWSALSKAIAHWLVSQCGAGALALAQAIERSDHPELLALVERSAAIAHRNKKIRHWLVHLEARGGTFVAVLANEALSRNAKMSALFGQYLSANPRNIREVLNTLSGTVTERHSQPFSAWGWGGVHIHVEESNPFNEFRKAPDFDAERVVAAWPASQISAFVTGLNSPVESIQTLDVIHRLKHPDVEQIIDRCMSHDELQRRAFARAEGNPNFAKELYVQVARLGPPRHLMRTWVSGLYRWLDASTWHHSYELFHHLTREQQMEGLLLAADRATRLYEWHLIREACADWELSLEFLDAHLLQIGSRPFHDPGATASPTWAQELATLWDAAQPVADAVLNRVEQVRFPAALVQEQGRLADLEQTLAGLGQLLVAMGDRGEELVKRLIFDESSAAALLGSDVWTRLVRERSFTADVMMGRLAVLRGLANSYPERVHPHVVDSFGVDAGWMLSCINQGGQLGRVVALDELTRWHAFVFELDVPLADKLLQAMLHHSRKRAIAPDDRRNLPWWHDAVAFVVRCCPDRRDDLLVQTNTHFSEMDGTDAEAMATLLLARDVLDARDDGWDQQVTELLARARGGSSNATSSAVLALRLRWYSSHAD